MLDDVYLVRLAGVESRDAAHAMRDSRLYVREEDRPQLLDDEFFVREMIGMDVVMGDVRATCLSLCMGVGQYDCAARGVGF